MPTSVSLPALGESVTEGTVTRWLKQVGDTVAVDEPLLEVSTDKVDTEIPSPVAGTLLEIKAAEDETVEVGAELAVIGDAGESTAPPPRPPPSRPPPPRSRPGRQAAPAAEAQEAPAAQAAPAAEAPAAPANSAPAQADQTASRLFSAAARPQPPRPHRHPPPVAPRSPSPPSARASPKAPSPAGSSR